MQLDQVNFAIRPRGLWESFDLAVAICRRHGVGIALAAAVGVGPFLVLNHWLVGMLPWQGDDAELGFRILGIAALFNLEAPWAMAPVTLYLGQLAFRPKFSARQAWRDFLGAPVRVMEQWSGIDIGANIQAMTKLPVEFAKDTTAACAAELLVGQGRSLRSVNAGLMSYFK